MGIKLEQGWTIKEVAPGKYYLYTWEYDAEATEKKRAEMREEMMGMNPRGYTPRDLGTKASRYKWKSLGRVNFDNPSPKLEEFLQKNLSQVVPIQRKIEDMKRKKELKLIEK